MSPLLGAGNRRLPHSSKAPLWTKTGPRASLLEPGIPGTSTRSLLSCPPRRCFTCSAIRGGSHSPDRHRPAQSCQSPFPPSDLSTHSSPSPSSSTASAGKFVRLCYPDREVERVPHSPSRGRCPHGELLIPEESVDSGGLRVREMHIMWCKMPQNAS